jgi:hypothetical protein
VPEESEVKHIPPILDDYNKSPGGNNRSINRDPGFRDLDEGGKG